MLLHARPPGDTGERSNSNMASIKVSAWSTTTRQFIASRTPRKSVHFADTKGLALVSTFFFPKDGPLIEAVAEKCQRIRKSNSQATRIKGESARLLNYTSPVLKKHFKENIERNNVSLEKTYCNRHGLYGRIQVKNIAFEKDIIIRYSYDSWATHQDQKANYIPGASIENTDTFFFHVAPPVNTKHEQKMEFAVCYEVEGETYWDNNFGDNYRLLYLPS